MLTAINSKEILSARDIIDINVLAGQKCNCKQLHKCMKDIEKNSNKENRKELSKFNFIYETIVNFITNDVIYNNIYCISSYMFGKKELFMAHIKANAFSETNILNIMSSYDLESKIPYVTDILVNSKTIHSASFRLLKDCNLLFPKMLLNGDS